MALLFHTVHTLPILNFQPADPTCGQAMCGVELVAPTPLVAALTERLLGLRCQVTRSSCSGLGSHQNPSSSWWGPGRSAASRSQKASQKKSWVTKSVSTKTLRGNVFFPSPVPLPFLINFSHKRCTNAAPLADNAPRPPIVPWSCWYLSPRRLRCHQLGVGGAGDCHVWTYDPVIPQIFPM